VENSASKNQTSFFDMCTAKKPKVGKAPPPPQMTTTVEADESVLRESQRERRRAATRSGRQSTILAGGNAMAPTGQYKTLLGS
jgi:hypothetical protein